MILRSYSRSEKSKEIPKKVELVDTANYFLEIIGGVLCRGRGVGFPGIFCRGIWGWMSVVTNDSSREYGEEVGERSIFLV